MERQQECYENNTQQVNTGKVKNGFISFTLGAINFIVYCI